jgi:phosphatidylglycerophosphatase A
MSLDRLALGIATAGGSGYAPIAPGTAGTAVAVPLAWLLSGLPLWGFAAVTAGVTLVGIWAAGRADEIWRTHDSGRIVIDEVAGYFVTVLAIDRSDPALLILAFFLFRALDIIKPPPVRAIDRSLGGGPGVVLDDVAAGIMGAALLWGLGHTRALTWVSELFTF